VNSSDIRIALFNALRNGPRPKGEVLQEILPVLRPSEEFFQNSGRANIPKWQHRVLTEVAYLRQRGKMAPHQNDRQRWALSVATAGAAPAISAVEGRERLRIHKHRERSGSLRRQKINEVLARTGKLECECCDRDAESVYGPIGRGFCEIHHLDIIAQGERRTELTDLAVVCACCHRILHRLIRRGLPASIADLRQRLESPRN
jgi:predicted HNH restriction endonuclease